MSRELGPFGVVVVDDNADVRELLRLRLDFEHELDWVGEADDGMSGLDLVDEVGPDAVILNVELPVLNGLEVLESLRTAGFSGVVVIYTASGVATTRAPGLGADAAFLKTAPVTSVLERVVALCRARSA